MIRLLRDNESFRLFWSGQTLSMFGNYILPVALTLYAALRLHSATDVGLVLGARAAGTVVMLLIGGALADLLDRRAVMMASDVVRAVLVASLMVGPRSLLVLLPVCFLIGAAEGTFYPAYNGYLPELVTGQADLQSANALNSVGTRTAAILGPSVAAVLVAWSHVEVLFAIDAATFLCSLVTLVLLGRRMLHRDTDIDTGSITDSAQRLRDLRPSTVLLSIRDGLREVRSRRWVAWMIAQDAINTGFAYAPVSVLLPILLIQRGYSGSIFGVIALCAAVGSVLGGLVGSKVRTRRPGVVALCLTAPYSLYAVSIAAAAPPYLLMALAGLCAAGNEIGLILWYSHLQEKVPASSLSRVNSVDWMGSMSLLPIGQALTGAVASVLGAPKVLLAAGVIMAGSTLSPLLSADVRTFGGTQEPTGDHSTAPHDEAVKLETGADHEAL